MNTDHIPDYIEPVVAWRAYKYVELLASLNDRMPFPPKVKNPATCVRLLDHPCPATGCSCGYYAHKTKEMIVQEINSRGMGSVTDPAGLYSFMEKKAMGQVYLWGRVLEFEHGYRAEFCYPKSILTEKPEDARKICSLYECEEETSCSWESLFGSTELNPFENQWGLLSNQVVYYRTPSPWKNPFSYPGANPSPSPKIQEPPKENRSVPKQLKAQVEQKQLNAKSDFWKSI